VKEHKHIRRARVHSLSKELLGLQILCKKASMAARNCFESLSEELLDNIFARCVATGDEVASGNAPLAAIRLTCKEWAIAGLHHVTTLRVRDATEVHHLRHILENADHKLLRILDVRLNERNERVPAILQELGRHAWEQMHLERAARNAEVWKSSPGTLTKLSTNNWGITFDSTAQEAAWEAAGKSGDISYFDSIAGFPMLDASLVACKQLRDVELTLDTSNLVSNVRFAPRRLWRLKTVKVLTVKLGRFERTGAATKVWRCCKPHSEYSLGLFLLSVAFPRVEHVKIPNWRFPLGIDVHLTPSMDITGWQGVRILELGTKGLPYTQDARVFVEGRVSLLEPYNWPDLETLIISGTFCKDSGVNPLQWEYIALVEAERRFLRDLKLLIIEHPVAQLLHETSYHESKTSAELWREDEAEWQHFLKLSEVRAGGWVGQREDLSNGATSLLTISRIEGVGRSNPDERHRKCTYDHEDAEWVSDADVRGTDVRKTE